MQGSFGMRQALILLRLWAAAGGWGAAAFTAPPAALRGLWARIGGAHPTSRLLSRQSPREAAGASAGGADKLNQAFDMFDRDRDGVLRGDELKLFTVFNFGIDSFDSSGRTVFEFGIPSIDSVTPADIAELKEDLDGIETFDLGDGVEIVLGADRKDRAAEPLAQISREEFYAHVGKMYPGDSDQALAAVTAMLDQCAS